MTTLFPEFVCVSDVSEFVFVSPPETVVLLPPVVVSFVMIFFSEFCIVPDVLPLFPELSEVPEEVLS